MLCFGQRHTGGSSQLILLVNDSGEGFWLLSPGSDLLAELADSSPGRLSEPFKAECVVTFFTKPTEPLNICPPMCTTIIFYF